MAKRVLLILAALMLLSSAALAAPKTIQLDGRSYSLSGDGAEFCANNVWGDATFCLYRNGRLIEDASVGELYGSFSSGTVYFPGEGEYEAVLEAGGGTWYAYVTVAQSPEPTEKGWF